MSEIMSRREFLLAGAVLVAGTAMSGAVGCAGPTASEGTQPVETPSTTYGGGTKMSKRILVGYATGTGYTVGVAEAIGRVLGERGFAVDVQPMKDRPSVDGYDAVVLGSAVNGGAWLPEAVTYAKANSAALKGVPTALFCVHAMNTEDTEKKRAKREAYLDNVRTSIKPCAEGFFAGKGPSEKDSGAFARFMFRAFGGDVEGDGRDWNKIAEWARALPV